MHGKLHELKLHRTVQVYIIAFDNMVAALAEHTKRYTIFAIVYGLKIHLKGFVKVQLYALANTTLN